MIVDGAGKLGLSVEDLTSFYNRNWNRRIALGLSSFYKWQFIDAPGSANSDHCAAAIDEDGALLGMMGLNPREFRLSGETCKGAELTTYVVAEQARGRGIGTRIMTHLQREFEVLLGAGITAAAIPVYMLVGFRFIRALPRFVRVYGELPETFLRTTALGKRLLMEKIERPVRAGALERVAVSNDLHRHLGRHNHFVRDARHFSWRYERHPVFAYEIYRIGRSGEEACLVMRFDDVDGITIAHVVECFGAENTMEQAVAAIDDICLSRGARLADFTCTATDITRFFRARGWFSTLDDTDVQATNLFYPPEYRDPPTTSLMLWAKSKMADLLDTGRLYFTKGDLDLDRPTIAYYEAKGIPT